MNIIDRINNWKASIISSIKAADAEVVAKVAALRADIASMYENALNEIVNSEHSVEDKVLAAFHLGQHFVNPNAVTTGFAKVDNGDMPAQPIQVEELSSADAANKALPTDQISADTPATSGAVGAGEVQAQEGE